MTVAVAVGAVAGGLSGVFAADLAVRLTARGEQQFTMHELQVRRLRRLLAWAGPAILRLQLVARLAPVKDLRSRIIAAGEPGGLGLREWISIKAGFAVSVGLASLPVAVSSPGRLGIVALLVAPLAGFLLPDFWLGRVARLRIEQALRTLPDMLDLMRVAVEAGVSPVRAMAMVSRRFDGPLAQEWRRATVAATVGTPFRQALEELAERLPDPQIRSCTQSLVGSSVHGSSLVDALAALAAGARHAFQQRIREQAAKAGPKIQLVVALIMVPSVLLVVAAGLISQLSGASLP